MRAIIVAIATAAAIAGGGARAAVTQDNFTLRTTADLIALCNATPDDPYFTAAANFCHGFVVGTYRALSEISPALRGREKLFCGPPHIPSRNEAVAAFIAWAGKQPDIGALTPTDGFAEYLMKNYPCPGA